MDRCDFCGSRYNIEDCEVCYENHKESLKNPPKQKCDECGGWGTFTSYQGDLSDCVFCDGEGYR